MARCRSILWLPLLALALGCQPLGPLPGGRLSGQLASAPPADWASTDGETNVQVETRPSDPYSVNVWGAGVGERFYLASGRGEEAVWARHIAADPNVRLRVGDRIYELEAVRVEDEAELERFLQAMRRKYEWEPSAEERERGVVYRLEPR